MRELCYNIDYEFATYVLLIILSFYLRVHYYGKAKANNGLMNLVTAEGNLILLDIISTITLTYYDKVPLLLNYIINTAYYVFIGLPPLFLILFIEDLGGEERNFHIINNINKIVYLIYAAVIIISEITGHLIIIKAGEVLKGNMHILVYLYPGSVILECLVIFIFIRSSLYRLQKTVIILLLVFSGLGGLMQMLFFPKVLLSNSTPALALFMCLFIVVSPDYNSLVAKRKELEEAKTNLEHEVIERTAKEREKEKKSASLVDEIIEAIKTMIDDSNTNRENHSENVSRLSVLIAKEMGFSKAEQKKIYRMAVVHDIGIIGIDEDVALKNGKYTDAERLEMQRHPVIGEEILKSITELPELAETVRSHHERFDGLGYPDHLKGKQIPIYSRIISVADSYDAMTENRPYRQVFSDEQLKQEFSRCSGKQYDPKVVRALFHVLEKNLYTPAES